MEAEPPKSKVAIDVTTLLSTWSRVDTNQWPGNECNVHIATYNGWGEATCNFRIPPTGQRTRGAQQNLFKTAAWKRCRKSTHSRSEHFLVWYLYIALLVKINGILAPLPHVWPPSSPFCGDEGQWWIWVQQAEHCPLDDDVDIDMFAANLQKIKPIANAMKEALQKRQAERPAVCNEAMQNTLQSQDWQKTWPWTSKSSPH